MASAGSRRDCSELNNKLTDAGHAKLTAPGGDDRPEGSAGESLKALDEYGKELVGQQHSSQLATDQAHALGAAISGGGRRPAAQRRQRHSGLAYNRTAEQTARCGLSEKLRTLMQAKSVESLNEFRKALDDSRDRRHSRPPRRTLVVADLEGDEATAVPPYRTPFSR